MDYYNYWLFRPIQKSEKPDSKEPMKVSERQLTEDEVTSLKARQASS